MGGGAGARHFLSHDVPTQLPSQFLSESVYVYCSGGKASKDVVAGLAPQGRRAELCKVLQRLR